VRQRAGYDAANRRTVKQTIDGFESGALLERATLWAMPGDLEIRGVETQPDRYAPSVALGTETQYLLGGARVVWKRAPSGGGFARDARVTYAANDLLQSTSAVIDLVSGELLEVSTSGRRVRKMNISQEWVHPTNRQTKKARAGARASSNGVRCAHFFAPRSWAHFRTSVRNHSSAASVHLKFSRMYLTVAFSMSV